MHLAPADNLPRGHPSAHVSKADECNAGHDSLHAGTDAFLPSRCAQGKAPP
jgi:hypothetical protein